MKATELRGKTQAELREALHDLLKEQFNLRMQRGTGQFSRPHLMKDVRRNIARVKTVIT
ncbi:MAG: 50S ribosomal protein L29, partial [Chromatiaceae bacterium]|nr:50S ribosomal protein L29 [Chromatiaceae bacterium]